MEKIAPLEDCSLASIDYS